MFTANYRKTIAFYVCIAPDENFENNCKFRFALNIGLCSVYLINSDSIEMLHPKGQARYSCVRRIDYLIWVFRMRSRSIFILTYVFHFHTQQLFIQMDA